MADYWQDKPVEEIYQKLSDREHALAKDMYAGRFEPGESQQYVVNSKGEFVMATIPNYSPALYKIFDEVIVNALDHIVRMSKSPKEDQVSWIKVSFDKPTGKITVANNGKGIPTDKHKELGIHIPQLVFGEYKGGSNLKKANDSIIGGTNGIGVKLTNTYSTLFEVEVVYRKDQTCSIYRQKWHDLMSTCDPPKITSGGTKKEYTKVSFLPDYCGQFRYDAFDEALADSLESLFKARLYEASVYAHWASGGSCKVYFNKEKIPITDIQSLAKRALPNAMKTFKITMKDPSKEQLFPWEVVIAVADNPNRRSISIVNGVSVRGGKHIEFIRNKLIDGVRTTFKDLFKDTAIELKKSIVEENLMIFGVMPIPGVKFQEQRKTEADFNARAYREYKIDETVLKSISASLKDKVMQYLSGGKEFINATTQKRKKGEQVIIDKYEPANKQGEPMKCSLLLPEGDSAASMCRKGLTSNPRLGFDYYGILTLRGVIVNVRKEIRETGSVKELSKKLKGNEFFNNLLKATGLNLNYKYDPKSSTFEKEMKELRYGCIIGCVDQDLDGTGFIFSLIINMFDLFWSNLLARGYIKRFVTPILRGFSKKSSNIVEFYSEFEYERWKLENNEEEWNVEYIKGLGTNEDEHVFRMFEDFEKNLFTYAPDKDTPRAFEILFGHDTDLRKELLTKTQQVPSKELADQQRAELIINATDHARYEAEPYKRSNLRRKLPSAVSGFNESGGKIINGAIQKFTKKNEKIRITELGASIVSTQKYHHGEQSLYKSIFGMGRVFPGGGTQCPILLPMGNFGSRERGGEDHAQPRYAGTKLNKELTEAILPPADKYILEYFFEEGARVEPKFSPIVPLAILENYHCPADGWKIKVWARDVIHVIDAVEALIKGYSPKKLLSDIELPNMQPFAEGYRGEFRSFKGKLHSFGKYEFDEKSRLLRITELPLRVWHGKYKDNLIKRKMEVDGVRMISNILNHSNDHQIDIKIQLAPKSAKGDPLEIIRRKATDEIDGFTEFFELRTNMDDHLNMLSDNGNSVIMFKSYEDVVRYWFPFRKATYEKRIDREIIILKLNILLLEETIKYIQAYETLGIRGKRLGEANTILESRGFIKMDKSIVENPRYLPIDKIQEEALHGAGANYRYLLMTTDFDKLKESVEAKKEKLSGLRQKLLNLEEMSNKGNFKGAKIWLDELDKLRDIVLRGREANWGVAKARKPGAKSSAKLKRAPRKKK